MVLGLPLAPGHLFACWARHHKVGEPPAALAGRTARGLRLGAGSADVLRLEAAAPERGLSARTSSLGYARQGEEARRDLPAEAWRPLLRAQHQLRGGGFGHCPAAERAWRFGPAVAAGGHEVRRGSPRCRAQANNAAADRRGLHAVPQGVHWLPGRHGTRLPAHRPDPAAGPLQPGQPGVGRHAAHALLCSPHWLLGSSGHCRWWWWAAPAPPRVAGEHVHRCRRTLLGHPTAGHLQPLRATAGGEVHQHHLQSCCGHRLARLRDTVADEQALDAQLRTRRHEHGGRPGSGCFADLPEPQPVSRQRGAQRAAARSL